MTLLNPVPIGVAVGPFNAHLYSLIASTSPGSKTSFVLAAYIYLCLIKSERQNQCLEKRWLIIRAWLIQQTLFNVNQWNSYMSHFPAGVGCIRVIVGKQYNEIHKNNEKRNIINNFYFRICITCR